MCGDRKIVENGKMKTSSEIEDFLHVWQTCFRDNEADIREFFATLGEHVRTRVYRGPQKKSDEVAHETNGDVVSMVHLVDGQVQTDAGMKSAAYIYAVGTLPEFQGKGYSSALLKQVLAEEEKRGRVCFLVPAEDDLIPFYEQLGLQVCQTEKIVETEAERNIDAENVSAGADGKDRLHGEQIRMLTAEKYMQMRKEALHRPGQAWLCDEALNYALKCWQAEGGQIGIFAKGENKWGVLYKMQEQELYIQEITEPDDGKAVQVAQHMAIYLGTSRVKVFRTCQVMTGSGAFRFNLAME